MLHRRALEYFLMADAQSCFLKKLFPMFLMSSATESTLSTWNHTTWQHQWTAP